MACFYNEKVKRHKTPFFILVVLLGVALLSFSTLAKAHLISGGFETILDVSLIALFLIFAVGLMQGSRVTLKYCLMPEELLVQRIQKDHLELVERVRLKNIQSFQEITGAAKLSCLNKDMACLFHRSWRLTYQQQGRQKTLILRPSDSMAEKIQHALVA
ncbi:hypothetical protein ABB02_00954 [Clostridiaceae bacterium JG1575]|nr:hypothetical protein ABB02_00954 [Clostridiaceae bacterium JG1575]